MKYLWKHIKSVENTLAIAGKVLLLLDFDGTLCPIVSTPQRARLSKSTKALLEKLSCMDKVCLGIISGRALADVKEKVAIKNIIYSGNHGMEWEIAGQTFVVYVPTETLKTLKGAKREMESLTPLFKGSLVEDKGLSVAFHYRRVLKKEKVKAEKILDEMLTKHLSTHLVSLIKGNETYDLRANLSWTKESITGELKKTLGGKDGILIYVGDSTTDEDVFAKLNDAITIKVGNSKNSHALYFLKNVVDVHRFLARLYIVFT